MILYKIYIIAGKAIFSISKISGAFLCQKEK